jgi:hypothetical protein
MQSVIVGGAVGVGVVAAIAIPNFIKAREAAQHHKSALYIPQPAGAAPAAPLARDLRGHAAGSEISAPAAEKKPAAL